MQETQIDQAPNNRRKTLAYVLVLVILIVLVGGGSYAWRRHQNSQAKAPQYSYSVAKTSEVKVDGPETGTGMIFNKPKELTQLSSAKGQIELEHLQTLSNGKQKMVSYIAAAASLDKQTVPQSQLDALNNQLTDTKNFNPSLYSLSSLNSFLKNRLPEGWKTSLSHGYTFTNGTIKKNAWYFNVSSKGQNPSQELDGKVVYAISQGNHYYYFTIVAQPSDWRSNSATWSAVLASLKIDQ